MIKNFIAIILIGFLNLVSFGQYGDPGKFTNKNAIYLELLGSGLFYSINYDRILWEKSNVAMSARIGASYIPVSEFWDFNTFGFPIECSFLKGRRNYLEIGSSVLIQQNFYGGTSSKSLIAFGRIGYRYQKKNGGTMFRIALTPFVAIIYDDENRLQEGFLPVLPWVGISIGRSF